MGQISPLGIRVTVSGSFHRGMDEIQSAVGMLIDAGVTVLSPADPRIVDSFGDFFFVASDRRRTIKTVQDRHLAAISASDFVWLIAPEGYVGISGAMEVGAAVNQGVPVFGSTPPNDLTLRQYVSVVPSVIQAISIILMGSSRRHPPGLLLDPNGGAERLHDRVDRIRERLLAPSVEYGEDDPHIGIMLEQARAELQGL